MSTIKDPPSNEIASAQKRGEPSPCPAAPSTPGQGRARLMVRRSRRWTRETWERTSPYLARLQTEMGVKARTCRAAVLRAGALEYPRGALMIARGCRKLAPRSLFLQQAEALLTARTGRWAAAAPRFAQLPAADPETRILLRTEAPAGAVGLAVPARERPVSVSGEIARGLVVYTTLFGRILPPPVFGMSPQVRFLCFTNRDVEVPGWEMVRTTVPAEDAEREAVRHKLCPQAVLPSVAPEAEASLFIAPEIQLIGNLETLLTRWLLPHDFVMWRDSRCRDWRDMIERRLVEAPAEAARTLRQAEALAAADLLSDSTLMSTDVIWRRHGDARVTAVTDAWWRLWQSAPGADDAHLYRLLNHPANPPPIRPQVMPLRLGTSDANVYFACVAPPAPVQPVLSRIAGRRLPIAFLYSKQHARLPSTFLRGEQLSGMITARCSDLYDVTYTADASSLRDQVVVVSKWALETLSSWELAALRKRNIVSIGSWDDFVPKPRKVRSLDAHMTLSYRQTLDLNRLYPATPAFLVTHHVNQQVARTTPPTDRLRTGYFGDLANTVLPKSLSETVDLHAADNTARMHWLEALAHYNCHWIVRRRLRWDGWKPFLKGFTAARCGAVIIITRDDGDALYYLGDDYPFYADGLSDAELEMAYLAAASAFGGPAWRMAQDIMRQVEARGADDVVCGEFKAMINQLVH
jgi:hypothetical protein